MLNKSGDPLCKYVTVRIFWPKNERSALRNYKAGPKQGINSEGVTHILEECSTFIEKKWPKDEYRLVELAPNRFNFVWECEREKP